MKPLITLILLLIFEIAPVWGQQAIAKIKYEEAEEAFAAHQFVETLEKLNEVEAILNSTNPRVMYLKIRALNPIIQQDPLKDFARIQRLRKLCNSYLVNYENLPDNEEKYRDVYLISEQLKPYPTDQAAYDQIQKLIIMGKGYYYTSDTMNYAKAVPYFKEALAKGDLASQERLGYIYYNGGYGQAVDYVQAYTYYQLAADRGDPYAQNGLANIYRDGVGGAPKDPYKSIVLYESASKAGLAFASRNLGDLYYENKGSIQDKTKALKFYLLSIQQGLQSANISVRLGLMYEYGDGTPIDKAKAFSYYLQGANLGSTAGIYDVGLCYKDGTGVQPDMVKAIEYLERAAAKNYASASKSLVEIYNSSTYRMKDRKKAEYWLKKYNEDKDK